MHILLLAKIQLFPVTAEIDHQRKHQTEMEQVKQPEHELGASEADCAPPRDDPMQIAYASHPSD